MVFLQIKRFSASLSIYAYVDFPHQVLQEMVEKFHLKNITPYVIVNMLRCAAPPYP